MGVGNVPSFRGTCYFVMRNLQLEDFGNGIPTFTVEVQKKDGTTFLHEIVEDICRESGMEDGEFDGLGYMPTRSRCPATPSPSRRRDARSSTRCSRSIPFDAAETDYRLVFNWINSRPKAIIRRQDFGAHESNSELPPSVEITRAQDFDLPRRLRLKFQEPARSYSPQHGLRHQAGDKLRHDRRHRRDDCADPRHGQDPRRGNAGAEVHRQEEPQGGAAAQIRAHRAGRSGAGLRPGRPRRQPVPVVALRVRRHRRQRADRVRVRRSRPACGVRRHHRGRPRHRGQPAAADAGSVQDQSRICSTFRCSPTPRPTTSASTPCWAARGTRGRAGRCCSTFRRAARSRRSALRQPNLATGSKWYAVTRNTANFAHGFAMSPLPDALPGVWDYKSRVRVYLMNKELDLSSANQSDMMAQPLNVALVGNEIVQFANAQDMGNGIWELSTFLRGLRGTDHLTGSHAAGERFVRLKQAVDQARLRTPRRSSTVLPSTGRSRTATPPTTRPASASPTPATASGPMRRPWSRRSRNGSNDILLELEPARPPERRADQRRRDSCIDQPYERYEIDVMNGATVVRTVALTDRARVDLQRSHPRRRLRLAAGQRDVSPVSDRTDCRARFRPGFGGIEMVDTPKLGIRLMASNDVAKEVVFNEATVVFDTMVSRTAKSLTNTPPVVAGQWRHLCRQHVAHRSLERPRQGDRALLQRLALLHADARR